MAMFIYEKAKVMLLNSLKPNAYIWTNRMRVWSNKTPWLLLPSDYTFNTCSLAIKCININQNNTRKWQRSIYWKGLGIGVHFHQKYRMCKQIKSRFSNSHATWEKCKNFHFIICYLVEWWMYVVQSVCFTWWNIFTMPSKKSDERVSRFFAQVFFILITYRVHVLN